MEQVAGRQNPAVRARLRAPDRRSLPGPACCRQSAILVPQAGHVSDITGLLKWKGFELALGTQHDYGLAVLVFGPGLHLVAREFEGNVTGLVAGPWKAQRIPVHCDLAAADTEEPAEVDDRRANLPGPIDDGIDDPTHIFAGGAANLLTEDS